MSFDPVEYKRNTRQQWEEAADAWNRWGPLLEAWLGEATQRMLDAAFVGPGSAVLDVAAGAGGQTIAAARRVGPSGRVVATDISPTILSFTAKAAAEAGLANIETIEADGELLEGPTDGIFDAVISRLGLIYLPDQATSLSRQRALLREGGRVSAIVYSTADRNEFFSIPVSIIRSHAQLPAPAPGQPGPFSLGQPGVLERALVDGGFRDVTVESVVASVQLPTASECVRFERESFGALHQMLSGVAPEERSAVWAEIAVALERFEGDTGFVGPCELLVGSGTR